LFDLIWFALLIVVVVVVVTFFNKTFDNRKATLAYISIKEHITDLGAITCKKIINLR